MDTFNEEQKDALGLEVATIVEPYWGRLITDGELEALRVKLAPIAERYAVTIDVDRHPDQQLCVTANPHGRVATQYFFPPRKTSP